MNNEKTTKNRAVRIILPLVLIVIIAGIWMVKNLPQNPASKEGKTDTESALYIAEPLDLEKLRSYGLPILIEFGSDSCAPCREMAPIIEELYDELEGKAIIRYVDVGEHPEFADGYPVSVIPTQLFFDSGGDPYMPADPASSGMDLYSLKSTGEHALTAHTGTISKEQLLDILKDMGME